MDQKIGGIERLSGMQQEARKPLPSRVTLADFRFYMKKENTCIFMPTGELWPGQNVNKRIPPIVVGADEKGEPITVPASTWLAKHSPCEQMTWAPGEAMLIHDQLIIDAGGWVDRPGTTVFNLYREPTIAHGDRNKAAKWLRHLHKVYPRDARRIVRFLAHAVQKPWQKVNHGLLLGGPPGIGKDSILAPAREAVGSWNFKEVSPKQMFASRFNGYLRTVILRVSEAHDLGEVNRFQFYEHLKVITAAPPEVLYVDEKNIPEYYIPNVCHVVITTNHKTDGLYLPADDRRTDVCWSNLTQTDFDASYWTDLWTYYESGGFGHVAAYLAAYDLSGFYPKEPPPKTQAFWDIVDANRAPEDAELAGVIDALALKDKDGTPVPGSPVAFTLSAVLAKAEALTPLDKRRDGQPVLGTFAHWLADRRNRRQIPHRFEQCGYSPVRNDGAKDGLWKVSGARQVIYALSSCSLHDRLAAAQLVVDLEGETLLDLSVGR
jgi:hypothetical protein